ncbi:MAG: preprotein translocase subunit SecE [Coprobacillus sp.]|nr:preprotein translocase subunit SecE [Coprobacillus sp.]
MGVKSYAQGVVKEGRRVRWPKRDVLVPTLIVVIIIIVIASLVLFFEDWLGNTLLQAIDSSFSVFENAAEAVEEVAEDVAEVI